ncbi:barstar family protein [Paenarthrobacter sp. NPDC056912]|uniref:barstar family protein n=1 Tax=Paenarthrobacter sp. NPDC056912 TaxID=3345965 RepID=UPI0036732779
MGKDAIEIHEHRKWVGTSAEGEAAIGRIAIWADGSNLAALDDCLRDVAVQTYGWTPTDTGLVLVIDGYETFKEKDAPTAHRLLEIFARQATYAALFGHRMMCLVRTGDSVLENPPVGGIPVAWNFREVPAR